jgi:hypothetical protein
MGYFLSLGRIFWSRVNKDAKLFDACRRVYCILSCKVFSGKNNLLKVEENAHVLFYNATCQFLTSNHNNKHLS